MTSFDKWIGDVLLRVVITDDPQWHLQYPNGVFSPLQFGCPIEPHNRYLFVTNDDDLAMRGMDLDSAVSFWSDKVEEHFNNYP